MARYPSTTECDEMELILVAVAIALVATAIDLYCAFTGTSDLPEAEAPDETV